MAKVVKGARFVSKLVDSLPTIPNSEDHTTGWLETDIYVGEWFFNTSTSKAYFRSDEGIFELVTVKRKDSSGQTILDSRINAEEYLPGNYLGAMVYVGVWDASLNSYPTQTPNKGDYWIVSVGGDVEYLSRTISYSPGDFVVFTGSIYGWEKIDNTEQIEHASMVVYDYNLNGARPTSYYAGIQDVQGVLDNIYENLYLYPNFTNTLLLNNGIVINNPSNNSTIPITINSNTNTSGKEIMRFVGHTSNKWITFNGLEDNDGGMFIGTYGNTNNIITFSPKGSVSKALTSTINIGWTNMTPTILNRWSIYSAPTNGYIKGYNDANTYENVKLTTKTSENNILLNRLVIGVDSSSTYYSTPLGALQITSNNTPTIISLLNKNSALDINKELNRISFFNGTNETLNTEYANIVVKTTSSSNQSKIGFSVKEASGLLKEGFTLMGTNTGMFVGINQTTPLYPLHVIGNTYLDGLLDVNYNGSESHNITGDVKFYNNVNLIEKLVFYKNGDGDILEINDYIDTNLKITWSSSNLTLSVFGYNSALNMEYDTLNSTLSLYSCKLFLNSSDLDITDADVNYYGNSITYNMTAQGLTSNDIISYNTLFGVGDFTSESNLVSKKYVDDWVMSHAVGMWILGTTPNSIVAYNVSETYYVGINKNDPTFNLDVVGNSKITGSLTLGDGANITGDLSVSNRIIVGNIITSSKDLEISKLGGSSLRLSNSNNTTNNETIGIIDFKTSNNQTSSDKVLAFIKTISTSTQNQKGALLFGVSKEQSTDAVEVMRISEDGNLLIGNSVSDAKLRIDNKTSYNSLFITSSTTQNYKSFLISNTGNVSLNTLEDFYLLNVNGTSYFTNNVGVGIIPSTQHMLTVSGNTNLMGSLTTLHNVGIGATPNSSFILNVNGYSYMTKLGISGSNANYNLYVNGTSYIAKLGIATTNTTYTFNVNGNSYISKLGVGAFDSNYYLTVNGSIKSSGIFNSSSERLDFTNAISFKTTKEINVGSASIVSNLKVNSVTSTSRASIEVSQNNYIYSNQQNAGILISDNVDSWGIGISSSNNMYFMNSYDGWGGANTVFSLNRGGGFTSPGYSNLLSNVGIGSSATQSVILYVNGNSWFNGNIGVGATSSTEKFKVTGTSYFTDNVGIGAAPSTTEKLKVTGTSHFTDNIGIGVAPSASEKLFVSGKSQFTDNIGIGAAPSATTTEKLKVTGKSYFTDNVGIGAAPNTNDKLMVTGTINTTGKIRQHDSEVAPLREIIMWYGDYLSDIPYGYVFCGKWYVGHSTTSSGYGIITNNGTVNKIDVDELLEAIFNTPYSQSLTVITSANDNGTYHYYIDFSSCNVLGVTIPNLSGLFLPQSGYRGVGQYNYLNNATGGLDEVQLTGEESGIASHSHDYNALATGDSGHSTGNITPIGQNTRSTSVVGPISAELAHENRPPFHTIPYLIRVV